MTEKEKSQMLRLSSPLTASATQAGFFSVPMQARSLHETDHWPSPHTVEGAGENLLA